MKKYLIVLAITSSLLSCSDKDVVRKPPVPVSDMAVTDLNDKEVKQNQPFVLDIDKNGTNDLLFNTWLIGDPLEQEDELLFFVSSSVNTALLFEDAFNGSPRFQQNETIQDQSGNGRDWYVVGQAELAIKNTGLQGAPYWEGRWKDASHRFVALQVQKEGKRYTGWVEISFDTANSKVILHRAAVSKTANRDVKAGL